VLPIMLVSRYPIISTLIEVGVSIVGILIYRISIGRARSNGFNLPVLIYRF
jgi:hypothetical protein